MSSIVQQPAVLSVAFVLGESFILPLTFQTKDQDGVVLPMDLTDAVFTARIYYGKGVAVQIEGEISDSDVSIDFSSLADPSYNSYDVLMEQSGLKRVVLRGALSLTANGGDPTIVSQNTYSRPVGV